MTIREFIQKIIEEAPDLDGTVYINSAIDDIECKSYSIVNISSQGSNDSVSIELEDWHP